MTMDDAKFPAIEKKIAEIRGKIDKGIMNPGFNGRQAIEQLRAAHAELDSLRWLLYESLNLELSPDASPPVGPKPAA
jgi:hypothetical protein